MEIAFFFPPLQLKGNQYVVQGFYARQAITFPHMKVRYAHLLRPLLAGAFIDVINFDRRDSDKIHLSRKPFLANSFLLKNTMLACYSLIFLKVGFKLFQGKRSFMLDFGHSDF